MIDELRLLRGDDFVVADKITVHHARLSEIVDLGESNYYSTVSSICATPSDYKAVLYDNFDIDWEEVEEFEFFLMMWGSLDTENTKLLLPDIECEKFQIVQKKDTEEVGLYNSETDVFINKAVYEELVEYIRKIHGLSKRVDKAGNESTKKYLLKKARREAKSQDKKYKSTLAPLVSGMVNSTEFKYDHRTVWDLNIYQFMDSVKRIQKIKDVNNIMHGIYSGNVDSKKISKDTLNWLGCVE
ncbi:MAG: hypothetical protein J6T96_05150 [Bacteroidales bacterium]|nr:hypothetical protein [Bacteroidales bacterium]